MANNKLSPMQRLLTKAKPEGECLVWQGDKDSNGYGRVRHAAQKNYPAHKRMYELHHGAIPAGLVVRHRCDNPSCINIAHLLLGTQKDNVADKYERGRANHVTGEAHGRAKLTQAQVDEARRRYVPGKKGHGIGALARECGVAKSTMAAALTGEHWKSMP
jgi:hypothetical protein